MTSMTFKIMPSAYKNSRVAPNLGNEFQKVFSCWARPKEYDAFIKNLTLNHRMLLSTYDTVGRDG